MRLYASDVLTVELPSPYEGADLADVDAAQNQDSMVFVHEDYAPRFLIPEVGTFYFDPIVFTNTPDYDFNDSSSPTPVSDVQVITFGASFAAGDTFQIDLQDAKTGAITYAGDSSADEQSATAENIATAVQKLFTVRGYTGVSCARTGVRQYTVTFAGASADAYELMSGITLSVKATSGVGITVTHSVTGTTRREDAWSATRGWPRTVVFFEGRLYFGGTRDLPQTLIGSKVNQILDFEIGDALDDDAIFTTLANQQLNAIQGMYGGRALQFFTSGGEFRYAKQDGEPVTPGDAPASQTQFGGARIRPVSIDGSTVYAQRTRKTIRDFGYDFNQDAYTSSGLSSLAPHLINGVVDLAVWNGSNTDEINLVFAVNSNGSIAVLNLRRDADVRAWTQWTTQGSFKAAASLVQEVYFLVERVIAGASYLLLEKMDDALYTDCAVAGNLVSAISLSNVELTLRAGSKPFAYYRKITTATAHGLTTGDYVTISGVVATGGYDVNGTWAVTVLSTTQFQVATTTDTSGSYVSGGSFPSGTTATFSGLDHLNGEECRVKADGFVLTNQTPAGGSITLDQAAGYAEVGLNFNPEVTPMPLNAMTPIGVNAMRKRRVSSIQVKVHETLGLLVNGRVLPIRKLDVDAFDQPVAPYSGVLSIEESTNWDKAPDKTVSFTQVDPLPMQILGIDVAIEWNE